MKKILYLFLLFLFFCACQAAPKENSTDQQPEITPSKISQTENSENQLLEGCFQLEESEGGNKAVTFIIMKIEGADVSGEQAIEMTGPEYNAVVVGSFAGKMENETITVIYDYEIEGSNQKEEQEFKLQKDGLLMSKGPLQEINGILVLKQKGLFNTLIPKIDCP